MDEFRNQKSGSCQQSVTRDGLQTFSSLACLQAFLQSQAQQSQNDYRLWFVENASEWNCSHNVISFLLVKSVC